MSSSRLVGKGKWYLVDNTAINACFLARDNSALCEPNPFTSSVETPSLAKMMKAVRFHGRRDIRLDDVPIPQCGRAQVKVCWHCLGAVDEQAD